MNIVKASHGNLSMRELYLLTMTPEAMKLSEHKDEPIDIKMWALYNDLDADGQERTLLSIVTPEDETYVTNSKTFQDEFLKIVDLAEISEETFERVKVSGGLSKNGREYITAVLA